MGNRLQVGDLNEQPTINPVASPVDTYVTPGGDKRGIEGMQQLAKALAGFSEEFQQDVSAGVHTYTQDEYKKAIDAAKANHMAFKDAVKKGLIPAGASPWFQKGYSHELGVMHGQEFADQVQQAWTEWPGKNSKDPAAFQQWFAEQRNKYLSQYDTNDSDFMHGFDASAASVANNLQVHQAAYHVKMIEEGRSNLLYHNSASDVQAFHSHAITKDQLIANLKNRAEVFYQDGGDGSVGGKYIAQAVIDSAKDDQVLDPDLVDVLKEVKTGTGYLGDKPEVKQAMEQAKTYIYGRIIQQQNYIHQQQELQKKEQVRGMTLSLVDYLSKNPNAPIPNKVMHDGTLLDPKWPKTVSSIQKVFASQQVQEDPSVVAKVQYNVYSGNWGVDEVNAAVNAGEIHDPNTLFKLYAAIQHRRSGSSGYQFGDAANAVVKGLEASLKHALNGNDASLDFNTAKGMATGAALSAFSQAMYEFHEKNPAADYQHVVEFATKTQHSLAQLYGDDGFTSKDRQSLESKGKLAQYIAKGDDWATQAVFPDLNSFHDFIGAINNEIGQEKAGNHDTMLKDLLQQYNIHTIEELQAFVERQNHFLGGK